MTERLTDLIQGATLCQCSVYKGKPHQLARGVCDPRVWVDDARKLDNFAGECNSCNLYDPSDSEPCEWIRGTESFNSALYYCEILRRALGGEHPPLWLPKRSGNDEPMPDAELGEQEELNFIADKFYGGEPLRPANTEEEENIGFKCLTRSYECFLGGTCDVKTKEKCAKENDHEPGPANTDRHFDEIPF